MPLRRPRIESLQARGETKVTTLKNHVTCIKTQKKRVTDHIARRKAEINESYQESLQKIEKRKAALDKQLDVQEKKLCKSLDKMKDDDKKLIKSIKRTSVLASKSMKVPSDGNMNKVRNLLSDNLKNFLDRDDPEKKLATDVADRAEQLIFTPNNQCDQLNIGEVRFVKCELECDVDIFKKRHMNCMAFRRDGCIAAGYSTGGINIFSADGQLQKTVLKEVNIYDVGCMSDGRYVVRTKNNGVALYTQEDEKLDLTFDTLCENEGGTPSLTVDSNDLIYIGYSKAKKIQVFSPTGVNAIREIPCGGDVTQQITSYNDVLIIRYGGRVKLMDKGGNEKYKTGKRGLKAHVAVTQNNSIIIAWVKHADGLVSIDEYTSDLKHVQTLISDHKIEKPQKNWYFLRQFRSGKIGLCTPNRLYIFNLTITPVDE